MGFVEGETLEKLNKRNGRLAHEIATRIASGLAAVQKQKLVHPDVKKFLEAKEGIIRDKSLGGFKGSVTRFGKFANDVFLHEVSHDTVEAYLQRLR